MRSIGDAGTTPTNATGNTLLKLIDLIINTDGIKKITDTVTVQATDLDIRNLTKTLDELYSVLKTDAGVAYDARARSWNLGASDVPDLSDRAARLLGRVYGSEGLQLKQEPTTGELHVKKIIDELPAGTQLIGKVKSFEKGDGTADYALIDDSNKLLLSDKYKMLFDFETDAEVAEWETWASAGSVSFVKGTSNQIHGNNARFLTADYWSGAARNYKAYEDDNTYDFSSVETDGYFKFYYRCFFTDVAKCAVVRLNISSDQAGASGIPIINYATYTLTQTERETKASWIEITVKISDMVLTASGVVDWSSVRYIGIELISAQDPSWWETKEIRIDWMRIKEFISISKVQGLDSNSKPVDLRLDTSGRIAGSEDLAFKQEATTGELHTIAKGSETLALKQRATTGEIHAIPGGLSYARCAADTQVKATAGFLHSITLSQTAAAAPTAGVLTIYDSAAESGTVILNIYLANAVLLPVTITLDVECGTGIYIGFDGTIAGIEAVVSYL
jgi:hypothetical protein